MARKTTTTTTTDSRKDSSGEWEEYHRTVVTVVERDDEGYPYGPLRYGYGIGPFTFGQRSKSGVIGDYIAWYDSLNARPAKSDEQEQEDGQDG